MNNFDKYKVNLDKLFKQYPYFKDVAIKRHNLFILFPDLENYTDENKKIYTDYLNKSDDLNILIKDILNIGSRIEINKTFYKDDPSDIQIKINNSQLNKIKQTLITNNIDETDFNEYLKDFINMIFESYGQYGKQSNGQYLSIEQINNKSRQYSLFDIDYKDSSDTRIYENFKLIIEIRNIQIKLYRKLYDFLNNIYDSLIDGSVNYEEEYNDFIIYINYFIEGLLETVDNKYKYDEKNSDLYNVLIKDRIYTLFMEHFNQSLNKLKDEMGYISKYKTVKYNTIHDMEPMIAFLNNYYELIDIIPEKIKLNENNGIDNTNNDQIKKMNIMIIKIKEFCKEYHINKGNITEQIINKYIIYLPNLNKINYTKERFIQHYVFPEIELLDIGDQTNIKEIVYSKKNHPKYKNNDNYNVLCNALQDYVFDDKNRYIVIGMWDKILPFRYCAKYFFSLTIINLFYKNKLYSPYYDLTGWSPIINKLYIKNELLRPDNKIKAIYKINDNNAKSNCIDYKELPSHYVEELPELLEKKISNLINNCIYIGIICVPTHKIKSDHDLLFYLFWDKEKNIFILCDTIGNDLKPPVILYYPFVTYSELIQVSKYLKDKDNNYNFYKKDNSNQFYISSYKKNNIDMTNTLELNEYTLNIDKQDYEYGGKTRKLLLCKNSLSGGKKYFIIKKQNKLYLYSNIIASYYAILFEKEFGKKKFYNIIPKKIANRILNILDPNIYLYGNVRLFLELDNDNNNIKNINDIINLKNPSNILNYKVNPASIFFWEMNYKYNIIEENFDTLYEITNLTFINEIFTIINDRYYPNKTFNINTGYALYLDSNIHQIYTKDKFDKIKNKKILINSYNDIKKIDNFDFLYIQIDILKFSGLNYHNITYLSSIYTILYLCSLIDKINIGGNICILFMDVLHSFKIKIMSIFTYLFEDFYVDIPESNTDRKGYFYFILKHRKKNINEEYLNEIKKIPSYFYYPDDELNDNLSDNDIKNMIKKHPTILNQIIINNKYLIKIKKKIIKQVQQINTKWYMQVYKLRSDMIDFYEKEKQGEITEEIIEEYKKKNIFQAIQWSKKYDFPLIPNISFDKFNNDFKKQIYKDIVSYEDDVLFKFKKHNTPEPNFEINKNIQFKDIPEYYKSALVKFNIETRALDFRDMTVYHQVKVQMDYYHKKLTKVVARQFKLYDNYISQAWLKMTEMLHQFDLIDKNKKELKTFHLCELPGAFINAIRFFIEKNTDININKWNWIAQSLNPAKLKDFDERKAFGDEANLLKKYPKNYDFGIGETGDITDHNNILYYKEKHGNNDFVTADCGLPLTQKLLSYKLTFSMYLAVFALLKKGGNCLIKRHVPVDNNQEIYMLYLFYESFEKVVMYKSRLNYQSQEYYLIGFNYKPINDKLFNKLIDFLKKYDMTGLIDLHEIDERFLLQLDKGQHLLLDNLNHFIKKKIYFADTFDQLTEKDWKYINNSIDEKIKEWLDDFPIINQK